MKTVIFDLGGVLVDFCHKKMCIQIAEIAELDPKKIQEVLFGGNIRELYEKGLIDSQYVHLKLCQVAKRAINFDELMHAVSNIFEPIPATIALIDELKSKGVKLLLLSNTFESHFEHAQKNYPFLRKFDGFLLSYKVGIRKPDPKIFRMALCMAGASPENCLYVDDVKNNTAAAIEAGLPSHHYTCPQNLASVLKLRQFL